MGKEKILRPDAVTVKQLVGEATRIDGLLLSAQSTEKQYRRAVQDAAQKLYDDRLQKALEEMDVEHINNGRQGIRVGLLREAGLETVWQVSQKSFQQLCNIDGLGEQSARKILDTVKQIRNNTKDTLRVRIQMENPAPVDDALIRSLYVAIHIRPLREQSKILYKAHHKPLQQELVLARKALSGFGWLFKSQTARQQIVEGA